MRIVESWTQNDAIFAYCVGEDIADGFSCNKISINGEVFNVSDIDIMTALSGKTGVVLKICDSGKKDVPHGFFKIVC